jgi:hypothetical protein
MSRKPRAVNAAAQGFTPPDISGGNGSATRDVRLSWTSGLPFANLLMHALETGAAVPTNTRQSTLIGGDNHGKPPLR